MTEVSCSHHLVYVPLCVVMASVWMFSLADHVRIGCVWSFVCFSCGQGRDLVVSEVGLETCWPLFAANRETQRRERRSKIMKLVVEGWKVRSQGANWCVATRQLSWFPCAD